MVYSWLSWRVYMAVAHLANNYLILYSYFLWNNPTDLLPLLVIHVCVCLLFPSLCLRMWSFGNYKKRSSRSATMDRFLAIFLSSLNLMTASTASHGFGLNLLRATWSQVSFPFTIISVCDVPSPHDSHIPCLCLTSCFLTIRLLPSLLLYWRYVFCVSNLSFVTWWYFREHFCWFLSPFWFSTGTFCCHVSSLTFQMRQWTFLLMCMSAKTLWPSWTQGKIKLKIFLSFTWIEAKITSWPLVEITSQVVLVHP